VIKREGARGEREKGERKSMTKIQKIWEGRYIKRIKKLSFPIFFVLSICMSGDPSGDRKREQERERERERERIKARVV
jgi:hypothetical protein